MWHIFEFSPLQLDLLDFSLGRQIEGTFNRELPTGATFGPGPALRLLRRERVGAEPWCRHSAWLDTKCSSHDAVAMLHNIMYIVYAYVITYTVYIYIYMYIYICILKNFTGNRLEFSSEGMIPPLEQWRPSRLQACVLWDSILTPENRGVDPLVLEKDRPQVSEQSSFSYSWHPTHFMGRTLKMIRKVQGV